MYISEKLPHVLVVALVIKEAKHLQNKANVLVYGWLISLILTKVASF